MANGALLISKHTLITVGKKEIKMALCTTHSHGKLWNWFYTHRFVYKQSQKYVGNSPIAVIEQMMNCEFRSLVD